MWTYPDLEEGAVTYHADKLSSATNPDIANSMAISFLLDRYSFPVVLPNSLSPEENSDRPSSESTVSSHSPSLSSSPPSTLPSADSLLLHEKPVHDPSTESVILRSQSTVKGTKRGCFKRFREESTQYVSNLPQYLRNINWMNRRAVEDVHWLLGMLNPGELDLTLALELLSVDFADMMVRRLAVQRLESLSDDDVLKYLLQLVQVGIIYLFIYVLI